MVKQNFILTLSIAFILIFGLVYLTLFSKKTQTSSLTELSPAQRESESLLYQILEAQTNEDVKISETSAAANLDKKEPVLGTQTSGPNYSVLTFDLGSITVVTDTAGDDDCSNNCPVKSVAQYVKDNGGRAGMNGTYFCPPDYSWCAGKVNSYDFPVWNNRKKRWMQSSKLFWGGRGMFVFRPGSAQFFPNASSVGAPADITGGIVNYPPLLAGGNVILDEKSLPDNLKITKGTRSGIGIGGGKLFLIVARRANMSDLARIFQSLGATDALNLDGGGSAALYQGGRYKAGPGRQPPNAIIVK